MTKKEKITVSNNGDHWICICNNNTMNSGFDTCDKNGEYIEPLADIWTGLYACLDCGRVINQETHEVVTRIKDLSSFGITVQS
ncbi:hypothetical protein [Kordia sp.]|uniref:hypothetical protein n=1 Tax=Kordia sp. TaxID=1965332 RepID=UPI003D299AC6